MEELSAILMEKLNQRLLKMTPCRGGCTAQSYAVETDKEKLFLKTLGKFSDVFIKEANGLKALAESGELNLPEVVFADEDYLCLKWIDHKTPSPRAYDEFGTQLAKHHRFQGDTLGFMEDNYIGRTKQLNQSRNQWNEFFAYNRLQFQYEQLELQHFGSKLIRDTKDHIIDLALKTLMIDEPHFSALHGDLWGGNHLMNSEGEMVLIDPAFYYGHREADLALMKLFGSYPKIFFDSYQKEWPLLKGHKKRFHLYQLYHALNHINLEGHAYLSLAEGLISKIIDD